MTKSNQTLVGAGKAAANQSRGSEAMVFSNPEFGTVRIQVDGNGELWFCLADICKALEIKNTSRAKASLKSAGVQILKGGSKTANQYGDVGTGQVNFFIFISEQNLYRLIMRSTKPQAEPFQDWVCGEVLPQIRKTGGYIPVREGDTGEDIRRRAEEVLRATLEQKNKLIREQEALLDGKCRIIAEQEKEIDRLLPKALYADTVLDSVSCFTTSQIAKELGMTAQELNRLLCARHIQYYQSGQYMLYAEYAHMGLAKSRTHYDLFVGADTIHTRMYLVWTERGRRFIHDNVQCIMNNV